MTSTFDRHTLLRAAAAIAAGGFVWWAVLGGAMLLLRTLWPAYGAAYPEKSYTLVMLFARLVIFSSTILAASAVATAIGRDRRLAWLAGAIILALSIPPHLYPGTVWDDYPPWYHFVYLASIVPLALVGGRLARSAA